MKRALCVMLILLLLPLQLSAVGYSAAIPRYEVAGLLEQERVAFEPVSDAVFSDRQPELLLPLQRTALARQGLSAWQNVQIDDRAEVSLYTLERAGIALEILEGNQGFQIQLVDSENGVDLRIRIHQPIPADGAVLIRARLVDSGQRKSETVMIRGVCYQTQLPEESSEEESSEEEGSEEESGGEECSEEESSRGEESSEEESRREESSEEPSQSKPDEPSSPDESTDQPETSQPGGGGNTGSGGNGGSGSGGGDHSESSDLSSMRITGILDCALSHGDYNHMDMRPGDVIQLPVYAGCFQWEDDSGRIASQIRHDRPVTARQLRQAGITAKMTSRSSARLLDPVELLCKPNSSYVQLTFAEPFVSTREMDFQIELSLAQKGGGVATTTLEGVFGNDVIQLQSGEEYADISDGIVIEAGAYHPNMELNLGEATVITHLYRGRKYYGVADSEQLEPNARVLLHNAGIDMIYTMKTVGLASINAKVKLHAPAGYYTYDQNMSFVGMSEDILPFSARYYLAEKRLDVVEENIPAEAVHPVDRETIRIPGTVRS